MLPSFKGAVDPAPGLPRSLFDVDAWQPSIVNTIADYIRTHGLDSSNRQAQAREILQSMLKDAKAHRRMLESFRLDQAGLDVDDWLCVVGIREKTRVRLKINSKNGKASFDLL